MSMPLEQPDIPDWMRRFQAEPMPALDDLLRGLARVPPYERAAPPDILDRLFETLPADHPDRRLLDETLRDWLAARRSGMTPDARSAYGLPRFVTEIMDALSAVWLLELPLSGTWIQDNYLDLARWAAPLRLSDTWDLPRALAQAAALTQIDQRLRFHWLRLCKDAARPSQRTMIDAALSGLSRLPGASGRGVSPQLIAGLSRFGAELTPTPRDQRDFLRRWRSIKARFPRTGNTWRQLWRATLDDRQYRDKPFIGWLTEAEPALSRRMASHASVSIPPNIPDIIKDLQRRAQSPEKRPSVLTDANKLLANLEQYAEATGDAYFFVASAGQLGHTVVSWAPGHASAWARDALHWSPGNPQAWDLRGKALNRLGRTDLAEAVYWEAARRLPSNAVVRNQLGLLLLDRQREAEAEALFREAHDRDPVDEITRVELARLLAATGREAEAEDLLRRTTEEIPDHPNTPYTLALLLIAWDRLPDAEAIRSRYMQRFGEDHLSRTLERLLAAGAEGIDEVRHHLAERTLDVDRLDRPLDADAEVASREAALEERAAPLLCRAADASRADLLFRVDGTGEADRILADLIAQESDALYPQVVWALHAPGRRQPLAERYREALGALAPHLAAAGADTPTAHWERLYEIFPERSGLIDFTRLMRSGYDEAAAERLGAWIWGGDETDAFLRARLETAIARDGRLEPAAAGLEDLLVDAIRREVDLGEGVLGEAA